MAWALSSEQAFHPSNTCHEDTNGWGDNSYATECYTDAPALFRISYPFEAARVANACQHRAEPVSYWREADAARAVAGLLISQRWRQSVRTSRETVLIRCVIADFKMAGPELIRVIAGRGTGRLNMGRGQIRLRLWDIKSSIHSPRWS